MTAETPHPLLSGDQRDGEANPQGEPLAPHLQAYLDALAAAGTQPGQFAEIWKQLWPAGGGHEYPIYEVIGV